jgi:mevalonate kinase
MAPERYEKLFNEIGTISISARAAIEAGEVSSLGPLMDQNHALLVEMGVSSPELEALVEAAHASGALGAKLSGAGRGGNMIALVSPESATHIAQALEQSGAVRTIITEIQVS